MIAHIISTGDEILLGDIIDTNAAFLCQSMKDAGVMVQKTQCVGDDPSHIARAIQETSKCADICMVTGGLGPTKDDLTARACADAAGVPLAKDAAAFESMKNYFKAKGFELTRENEKQAMLPEGAGLMINHKGTAPGFYIKINQCVFFFLPGPPLEMTAMFADQVRPVLKEKFDLKEDLMVERLTVFMLKESLLGKKLDKFERLFADMQLGIRVSFPTIEVKLRFSVIPEDRKKALSDMAKAKQWVLDQLGDKVVSKAGKGLVQEVADLLLEKNKTLAVAESCTGGLISNMLTDIPGSSDYFMFSGVTYSNAAKTKVLNVKEQTLKDHGAVSEQTAREMARGVRLQGSADIAISTTGIAGPTGGTDQKPVGMVCIGLATGDFLTAKTFVFKLNDRDKNKKMFAATALEMLRKYLVSALETL